MLNVVFISLKRPLWSSVAYRYAAALPYSNYHVLWSAAAGSAYLLALCCVESLLHGIRAFRFCGGACLPWYVIRWFMTGLKNNRDFSEVYRRGQSKADRRLVVCMLASGRAGNRFGVSVSKKVGNSVVRHRIKRRLKEIYRLHEDCVPSGFDIVVIARNAAADSDYQSLEYSLLKLFDKFSKKYEKNND